MDETVADGLWEQIDEGCRSLMYRGDAAAATEHFGHAVRLATESGYAPAIEFISEYCEIIDPVAGVVRIPPLEIMTLIGYWRVLETTPRRTERQIELSPPQDKLDEWYAQYVAENSMWPDPRHFVDPTWAASEGRHMVDFLERCTLVNQWRGLSECRFCGQKNGSAEITDGAYCWPEGLAHYVDQHEVQLPDEFVAHVEQAQNPTKGAPRPSFDDYGQRDRSWPGSELRSLLWEPKGVRVLSDGMFKVITDGAWWATQSDDFGRD